MPLLLQFHFQLAILAWLARPVLVSTRPHRILSHTPSLFFVRGLELLSCQIADLDYVLLLLLFADFFCVCETVRDKWALGRTGQQTGY